MDKNKEEFVKLIVKEYPIPTVIFSPPTFVGKSAKEFKAYKEYLETELNKANKAFEKLKEDS